jgi:alpha-1,3-mannosyltransferase
LKDADIAHVHNIGFLSDFIVLTKWLHRKRIVVNTHGGFFHTKKIGFLKGIYLAWLKLLFRGVDLVIADSKSDFEIFSNVTKKIVLIENGVELESFEQLRRNPKKNSFLFLGRLSKNKRIDLLLETFAELKKKGIGFRLLVVGKDFEGLLAGLKTRARELGIGKETEFFPDASDKELLSLLSSSEFFVSASSFEGFGIAAIEAMAAGCIPILNDIPCFKDFVNDGKSGFIADFFEPKKAAEKIMSILQLGKKRLAAVSAAARYSAQRFSFEKKIPQFVSAYWQVLK